MFKGVMVRLLVFVSAPFASWFITKGMINRVCAVSRDANCGVCG